MQDFSVEGVSLMFGPFVDGRDKIFLLGEALNFGVIFQKFALKHEKLWQTFRIYPKFSGNFAGNFCARCGEKHKYYMHKV